jgi:uncharacterized membrane protein YphA (DoxX/SURF4 family)
MHHHGTTFSPASSWSRPTSRDRPVPLTVGGQRSSLAAHRQGRRARWSMAIIFLLFAYEWFVSGMDKVLSPDFRTGLAANLKDATKGNPNQWYVDWLNQTIIPHARTIAVVVEVGELLVALGFVLGAFLWWRGARFSIGWRRLLHIIVLVTLLASAFMAANYYFLMGETVPWLKTTDPFDEGLSIDGLLTLIALALFVLELVAWPRRAPATDALDASGTTPRR